MPSQTVVVPSPVPLPRVAIHKSNAAAYEDFRYKSLGIKRIEPHSVAAGFVYLPVKARANLRNDLAEAQVYIPDLYRSGTRQPMMFLEINLKAAVSVNPIK